MNGAQEKELHAGPLEIISRVAPEFPAETSHMAPVPWVKGNPAVTEFMHSLSLLFPEGETYFVRSVQNVLDRVITEENKHTDFASHIRGFVAQEYRHTALHEQYNQTVVAEEFGHGEDTVKIERWVKFVLRGSAKLDSFETQLGTTVALEHFTAIMAHMLLGTPQGSELLTHFKPFHRRVWIWHAVEETEHKAVCFDVYKAIGGSYFRRVWTMLRVTVLFLLYLAAIQVRLLYNRKLLFKPATWVSMFNFLLFRPGLVPRLFFPWLDYFRPNFHPWDHDNSTLIPKLDSDAKAGSVSRL